ncbi:MAG: hypothetical protein IT193_13025 [Propionibacteriaceae bacterium]|nr:hypothetical protein [Propionibacteriaceae bacterium]
MTVLQSDRRRDPYPYTWEIPVGILTGWLLAAGLGVHLARALANWFSGAGWTWPTGRGIYSSLPAVLAGDPTAGLATTPGGAASPAVLTGWLIATQLLIAAGYVAGLVWALHRWGPGRMKGMATAEEAERVLGLTRLRRVAGIIRPDLHPTTTTLPGGHDGYHPH